MRVILKTVDGEIGRRIWPTIPAVHQLIQFKGVRYYVSGVVHDMDTKDDVIIVLERV